MKRLLVVALSVSALSCAEHHAKAPERVKMSPQRVQVEKAQDVSQALHDEVVGTVRARSVTAISASVMGTVRTLRVTLGSRVRAGDVLIGLSAGEIEAQAAQAEATFARAQLELQRAEQLKASQSISASQYDTAAAEFRVAEAALKAAEVMHGYTVIRAPVAGVVSAKSCDVGDLAVPGKPLLVLESPGALRLEASVPEAIAQSLHVGDQLAVHVDALERELAGTVSELSPSADPASRTLLVKLDLPQTPELRAGMFGRVLVKSGDERATLVPASAVQQRGQMEVVYVVDEGKARLRLVRTGRHHGASTEILAGLSPEETVVVESREPLVEGQPVEIAP